MSDQFPHGWTAEILKMPPLIAPVRQYVWPQRVAGEEDALARGALLLMVRPGGGENYLVTCALGFSDPALPTDVWGCPDGDEICAVAGGYAYVAPALRPESCTMIGLKPVVAVVPAVAAGLLLFVGLHRIVAWGRGGFAWQTARLSWEGIRVSAVDHDEMVGFGWNLMTDKEVEFRIDLQSGKHVGGGWSAGSLG